MIWHLIFLMTVAAEKQRVAEEVANMLAVSVDIDTSASKAYVDILAVTKMLFVRTFCMHRPYIRRFRLLGSQKMSSKVFLRRFKTLFMDLSGSFIKQKLTNL